LEPDSQDDGRETQRSLVRAVLAFLFHQFMGAFGVLVLCPWLLNLFADVVRPFGWTIYARQVSWLLGGSPYYPVQIVVALLVGRFFGFYYRQRSALWVWVVPLVLLCARFAAFSPSEVSVMDSAGADLSLRFSHFFGFGCGNRPCHDEIVGTLPFYSAVAYSLGALAALRSDRVPKHVDFMKTLDKKRANSLHRSASVLLVRRHRFTSYPLAELGAGSRGSLGAVEGEYGDYVLLPPCPQPGGPSFVPEQGRCQSGHSGC